MQNKYALDGKWDTMPAIWYQVCKLLQHASARCGTAALVDCGCSHEVFDADEGR